MPSNKDRLYVVLYARGGGAKMPGKEDTYHWALMVGPKIESEGQTGVRHHAKERPSPDGGSEWYHDRQQCSLRTTSMLLVRILVAKVANRRRLEDVLNRIPVRGDQTGWNCVSWVQEALDTLRTDPKALARNVVEWAEVRKKAMEYCQFKKEQHRFDGKGNYDMNDPATYDLLQGKETIV